MSGRPHRLPYEGVRIIGKFQSAPTPPSSPDHSLPRSWHLKKLAQAKYCYLPAPAPYPVLVHLRIGGRHEEA